MDCCGEGAALLNQLLFLTSITHAHRVVTKDIFGPVLSVMTFRRS